MIFTIDYIFNKLGIKPTDSQRQAIEDVDGPLLLIAGPGAGKTQVLILRTLNLILVHGIKPDKIMLSTFTEKAAKQLFTRLTIALKKLESNISIADMTINTIHGICNQEIKKNNHLTEWGKNYRVLDELSQCLFIYEHFNTLFDDKIFNEKYLGKWSTKWTTIKGIIPFLNKITEELININGMLKSDDRFINGLAQVYQIYQKLLIEYNTIDFSFQQKIFYELVTSHQLKEYYSNQYEYIMVDEYQDTNFVQEQILFNLAESKKNICVVGDEDQGLYRFRGATIRNILEFENKMPRAKVIKLEENFRSHRDIVEQYNKFMQTIDWNDRRTGKKYRYEKEIIPSRKMEYSDYQGVISIWGDNKGDEAKKVAHFIKWLRNNNVISDYNQVAILMRSVKDEHSTPYIEALLAQGIKSFCPRARNFFNNEEIQFIFAAFALILGYYGDNRGDVSGKAFREIIKYIDDSINMLARRYRLPSEVAKYLKNITIRFDSLKKGETTNERLLDIFYTLLSFEPFSDYMLNETSARNLSVISELLFLFQDYYGYSVITQKNLPHIRLSFFNSFLKFLMDGGINEYEDPFDIFPSEHVQIMTIHQSKGLEFPVVITGGLDKNISSQKQVDEILSPYYKQTLYEPMTRITEFDRMRLFYVSFSRAQDILVLSCDKMPKDYIVPVWEGLPQWPSLVDTRKLARLRCEPLRTADIKKSYSLTGDVAIYETCPRQYQYYKDYGFVPSRAAGVFFGTIVHQTIEDIHRTILLGKRDILSEDKVKEFYQFNYDTLFKQGVRPLSKDHKAIAEEHCLRYFRQNSDFFDRIIQAELDVSVEKEKYILTGVIDLLMGKDGKLEVLDFKSTTKPEDLSKIEQYKRQLAVYADILKRKYNKYPERAVIYWTGEETRDKSIMEVPLDDTFISNTEKHFDEVVEKIEKKCYKIIDKPESKICNECDLKSYCNKMEEVY